MASVNRATCWVTSTSATARSRVALKMESPKVQTSTTSPVVAVLCCHSMIAQPSKPMVSTTVMAAWVSRSFSR